MNTQCQQFWQTFQAKQGLDSSIKPEVWFFCNTEKDANHLADLVEQGIKTATCSLLEAYEEGEELPQEGQYSLVTDFHNNPRCIIQTIKVDIIPYKEVTTEFAAKEGEGDRSLAYWRRVHWAFFDKGLKEENRSFKEDMELVCEEFVLCDVYKSEESK